MSFRAQIKSPWFTNQSSGFSSFPKGFRRPGCHAKGSIGCSSEYPLLHFLAQVWKHTAWRLFFQGRCGESRKKKHQCIIYALIKRPDSGKKRKISGKWNRYIKKQKGLTTTGKDLHLYFCGMGTELPRQWDTAVALCDNKLQGHWESEMVRGGHATGTAVDLAPRVSLTTQRLSFLSI